MKWLFRLLLFIPMITQAQQKIQVVTKTVEKEWGGIQRVVIKGKKADVIARGWNKPTVLLQLRRVSKHPDRTMAETELDFLKYHVQVDNGTLRLNNSFQIPQQRQNVQSQLKAVYELWLPENTKLEITDSFGDVELTGLRGETNLEVEFGAIKLTDLGGQLRIQSQYSDIDGTNISGKLVCEAEKAAVTFRQLNGNCRFKTYYGKLTLTSGNELARLDVNASRTPIFFNARHLETFRFNIRNSGAEVYPPDSHKTYLSRSKQAFVYAPGNHRGDVSIQNSYSPISIQ